MFKADLIDRAASFRSVDEDPTRNLSACPTLVLNADYTPLSYYPLSVSYTHLTLPTIYSV